MGIRAGSRLPTGSARTATAAAALLPVLALTAACGGGGSDTTPRTGPSGSLAAAALTKALLSSDDVSHVQVVPATSKGQLLGGAQKADKPACQPVADQWSDLPRHQRMVYAGAMVTDTADAKAKTISLSVVAAYRPGDAKAVLDDLTAALKSCTSYTTTRNKTTTTFAVKAVAPAGRYGDQQVTYTIGDVKQGPAGTVLVTVVRVGDTTAAYETLRADRKPAALRAAIPLKQAAKLRKAVSG